MTLPDGHDAWHYVRQHIPAAIDELSLIDTRGIEALLESRFREGERQYRGDWLTRPPHWFEAEAAQEIADFILYGAMRRVIEDGVQ
jgi:hypothetical protein